MKKLLLFGLLFCCAMAGYSQSSLINRTEYYIDTDPGPGNGTAMSLTGADSVTDSISVPAGSLSAGVHRLYIRYANEGGEWGNTVSTLFTVTDTTTTILTGEYFVDTDPGAGNGTAFTTSNGDSSTGSFSVSASSLGNGVHKLYVRYKGQYGGWGNTVSTSFTVTDTTTTILSGEYFVDTDPGAGNGTSFTTSEGDSSTGSFSVSASAVGVGSHKLYVRYKGQYGGWGNTVNTPFTVNDTTTTILTGEYFVDTDPGAGNGTSFTTSEGDSSTGSISYNTSSLGAGAHKLYVRYKGQYGGWGNTANTPFTIADTANYEIVAGEYFIDTDPGVGNGTAITFTGADSVTNSLSISTAGITGIAHRLYIRYRDVHGIWGNTVDTAFNLVNGIAGTPFLCSGATTALSEGTTGGTWSSGNTGVATIGSGTGLVTGLSAGTAIITYNVSGVLATVNVTVNPLAVAGAITGAATVCAGATIALTESVSGGVWSGGSTAVATVNSSGYISGIGAGTAIITYTVTNGCGSASTTTTITVNPVPAAIGGTAAVCTGAAITLTDGTSAGTWSSSNTSIVTIGTTGIVTGVATGNATIEYTVGGCSAAITITDNPLPVAGVITGDSTVCAGTNITLADAAGGGAWSSGSTAVATVSSGYVSGISAGTSVITYSVTNGCGTAATTTTITVNPSPSAITGTAAVCAGSVLTLTDSTSSGVWSSSNTAIVTIGSTGMVTGVAAGNATIDYTVAGCSAAAIVTVNPLPVAGVITGDSLVCSGADITLADAAGGGAWSSDNTAVATVSSGNVGGVSAGTTTIAYSVTNGCGSVSVTKIITVNPIPSAIAGTAVVCAGSAISLTDTTSSGVWSSSNTPVATIDTTGMVTGIAAGNSLVDYTVAGCSAAIIVTVNPLPVAGVISGDSTVCAGANITLADVADGGVWSSGNTAAATLSFGTITGVAAGIAVISYSVTNICGTASATQSITVNPLPAPISADSNICAGNTILVTDAASGGTWSTYYGHASIDSAGYLTGRISGTEIITYTLPTGCNVQKSIIVDTLPGPVYGDSVVCVASTGYVYDSIAGGRWRTNNVAIAAMTDSGAFSFNYVYGAGAGVALITYELVNSCGDNAATRSFTVNPLPTDILMPEYICITDGAMAYDATPGGTWSAANGNVTIDGSGNVTGVYPGPYGYYHYLPYSDVVSYTLPTGCYVQESIWLDQPAPPLTGDSVVYVGSSISLSDVIIDGNWSSSNTSVANASGSPYDIYGPEYGSVSGVVPGTAVISYTDSNSCGVHTVSKTITVVCPSAFTLEGITGPSEVCVGSAISLYNSISGGSWTSSNTSIATCAGGSAIYGVTPGTVTITYTVTNSCGVSSSVTANVTVVASPVITVANLVCVGDTVMGAASIAGGTWSRGNTNIVIDDSGIITGVYNATYSSVTYTLPDGCSASASLYIGLPVPDALLGDTILCRGAETGISEPIGFNCSNYPYSNYWSSSNPAIAYISYTDDAGCGGPFVVVGDSAGTAIITFTDTNSCGVYHVTKSVTVTPTPVAITLPPLVCVGDSVAATVSPVGGMWSNTDGNVSIDTAGNVTGINNGTYSTIIYTLPDGCSSSGSLYVGLPVPGALAVDTVLCQGTETSISEPIGFNCGTNPFSSYWSNTNAAIAYVTYAPYYATCSGPFVVYGVSPGIDTVTYTDSNACGSYSVSKTVHVVVSPSASVDPIILSQDVVCVGGTALAGDSTLGGVWSIAGGASISSLGYITGITSEVSVYYTLTVTLPDGCFAAGTASAAISVETAPAPIMGDSTVRMGYLLSLTDIVGGGIWSSSNPSIATVDSFSGNVTGVSLGIDTITYTVTNSCGTGYVIKPIKVTFYCAPSFVVADSSCSFYGTNISEFVVSGAAGTMISDFTSCNGVTNYEDLSASMSVDLDRGNSYSVQIRNSSSLGVSGIPESGQVWIDFNNDGVFESSESVGGILEFNHTAGSFTIAIPAGVPTGSHTMRVEANYSGNGNGNNYPDIDPCATDVYFGDARDYTVIIGNPDAPPAFVNGHTQSLNICEDAGATSINSYLAVIDSDAGLTETWSIITGASHGTLVAAYTTISTGDTLIPSGITYLPASGYTGPDTFKIRVTDGFAADTTTVYVSVNPLPSAGTISGTATVCAGSSVSLIDGVTGGSWTSSNTSTATVNSSGNVAGITSGTTTVSYTITSGCGTAVATQAVTVNALPTVGTTGGGVAICSGATATLSGTGALTYSWTGSITNGVAFTPSVGTNTYTVTGTTNGCSNTATATVTVNALPTVGTTGGGVAICSGATATLSGTGATTYSWTGGITNGVAFTPSVGTNTYTVTGTTNGCSNTATVTVTVNAIPTVGTTGGGVAICSGATATLSGTGATTYSWTGGITNGVAFTPSVGTNTYTVTGTTNGCTNTATATVTVNAIPTVGTTGGGVAICSGATATLSGTGALTYSWTGGITNGVAFTPSVGTNTYTVTGTTNGCTNTATATVTVNAIPTVGTTGGGVAICSGATATLSGTGALTYSWTGGITNGVAFTPSVGTNTYTVTGTTNGCSNTATATVTVNALPTVGTTGGGVAICSGATATLSGTGATTYSWTGSITNRVAFTPSVGTNTYTVTGTTNGCTNTATATVTVNALPTAGTTGGGVAICSGATATLSGTGATTYSWTGGITNGVAFTPSVGTNTYTVTGTTNGCSNTATATVTVNATPAAIGGTFSVCGTATTTLTDATTGGTWASGTTTVANIGSSTAIVTGVTAGTTVITYKVTATGCTATATFTDNANPEAIGANIKICEGATITLTDATTGGTWASGTTTVATTGSTTGVVGGVAAGTSTITYKLSTGCSVTAHVTVNASPATIAGTLDACAAATTTLTDATTGGHWTSGTTTIATVGSSTGTVTGVATGTSAITYALTTGCAAMKIYTVNASPVAIGANTKICAGSTITLTDATTGGTWASGTMTIATAGSTTGVVRGVAAGTSMITYKLSTGCSVTTPVTVSALPVAIAGTLNACAAATTALTDATTGGAWTSGTPSIATVGSTGIVTGVATGTSIITYDVTATGCTATKVYTVNASPVAIGANTKICAGSTITLTDATTGGTWVSGTMTIATAGSTTGVVRGVAAGTSMITYKLSTGCSVTTPVTVSAVPATIAGTLDACAAATTALTDATTGGAWTSGTTSIATVGSTGIVTGVATGTSIITYDVTATGCTATKVYTVNASPVAIGANTKICAGSTITLTDATTGGTWASGTTTVATAGSTTGIVGGVAAGTSVITYKLSSGCSVTAPVTVSASPAAITGTASAEVGATTTLADATTGGHWTSTSTTIATVGSSTGIVKGVASGSTTISYTLSDGCAKTDKVTVAAGRAGSNAGNAGSPLTTNDIRVIPNPNNGIFTIKGTLNTTEDEEISIQILNMLGQVIYRTTVMTQNGEINNGIQLNGSIANGMYLLSLRSENDNKVFHIVIEQ